MNKLLIVDDSSTMRQIIMRVVRQADIEVETILEAASAVEALAQLRSHPDVDLILTDVNMPEASGVDLLHRVRESSGKEQLPVILVATGGGEALRDQALEGGANGYLCKPFSGEAFKEALLPYVD